MFGVASFAQTSFASLAGTSIAFAITENFGSADFSAQQAAFLFSQIEPVTSSDIDITGNALFIATINESLTPNDSSTQLSTFLQSISEDFTPEDAITIAAQFVSSLTEDTSLADAQEVYSEFLQARTEGFTADDASTQQSNFFQDQTENANLADTPVITAQFPLVRLENSVLADASTQQYDFLQSRAENANLADALAISAQFAQSQSENSNLADASTQQSAFLQSLTENANLADTPTIIAQFAQSISEGTTLQDFEAITAQFVQSVTEGLAVADIVVIIQVFFESVVENFSAADATTITQGFFFSVLENLNSADANTVLAAFQFAITENAVLADAFGVGGWIKIINDQASGWTLINNKTSTMTGSWNACAASPSAVVLLNRDAQGAYLLVTNGGTRTLQLPSTDYYGAVTYVNGRFYVFNTSEGAGAVPLLRSIDGVTWEVVNKPVTTRPVVSVFGNGTQLGLVIRGAAPIGTYSYISTDNGATWTQGGTPASGGDQSGQVVWDGTKYVRCLGSYISTSTDGLNWNYWVFSSGKVRGQIVWDGTTYVAVLSAQELLVNLFPSEVYVSNDGTSWTLVPEIPASRTASVLTRFAGGFVILNSSGAVLQLNPVNQTFTALSQIPDIVFPLGSYQGATAATRNGVTYLPGERPSAYDGTYLTTINFTSFTPDAIANFWTGMGDSQNPNWQNIDNSQ